MLNNFLAGSFFNSLHMLHKHVFAMTKKKIKFFYQKIYPPPKKKTPSKSGVGTYLHKMQGSVIYKLIKSTKRVGPDVM